jgi:hypothetical protein
MYSLSGGRRLARQRASSDPTPMNHSNKDRRPSAESEEGRPLIKENAGQPNTYPTQSGKGVSQGLAGVSDPPGGQTTRQVVTQVNRS